MKNSTAVREHQVVRVEPVPALDHLVVPLRREVAFRRDHPALARAGRGARHRRALGERHLRLERECAEAHAGDVDRDVELERLLGETCAEHRLRLALLAVALDHEAGERAGEEDELVPVRHRLEDREAAHPVAAELRLHVDVVDDLGREDPAVAEDVLLAGRRFVGHHASIPASRRWSRARQASPLRLTTMPVRTRRGEACLALPAAATFVITAPASARKAPACRSCRAPSRRRTSGSRAARRVCRCRTCAR